MCRRARPSCVVTLFAFPKYTERALGRNFYRELKAGISSFDTANMGGCVSTSAKRKPRTRKYFIRSRNCRRKVAPSLPPKPRVSVSDAMNPLTEFALSEFVQMDLDKNEAAHGRTEVSNLTLHLTQLEWHSGQLDASGNFQPYSWFFVFLFVASCFNDSRVYRTPFWHFHKFYNRFHYWNVLLN